MDKISELNIRAALRYVCERYELTADYQKGNSAVCWRVTFMNGAKRSIELVGTTRREIYNAIHDFRYGMEFAADILRKGGK